MDINSESDPYVRLMLCDPMTNQWRDIGTTEQIKNTPNPDFAKSIKLDYIFELHQPIYAEVLDYDGSTSDYIGNVMTSLGEIVGRRTLICDVKDRSG
jgi:hypothetical protein